MDKGATAGTSGPVPSSGHIHHRGGEALLTAPAHLVPRAQGVEVGGAGREVQEVAEGGGAVKTPQWEKKLGGHAGELYVAAELSKRGIPNALLPENFTDDDIIVGSKDGEALAFVQVKSCHPDRASSFILRVEQEAWVSAPANQFVVFVWLGSPGKNEPPRYWVAPKAAVGAACVRHSAHALVAHTARTGRTIGNDGSTWTTATASIPRRTFWTRRGRTTGRS